MTVREAETGGVRSPGRAAIAARTLRADRWWAYPAVTFGVLAAFVGYATYAAVANRDYFAAPYISPFHSPCLSFHCGTMRSADQRYDPLRLLLRSWNRREVRKP